MMRPTTRILFAGALAAATLTLGAPGRAVAAILAPPNTGIVVGGGTVQPVGDPHGRYIFDAEFKPVSALETIEAGDFFTVTALNPIIPFYFGTNGQPPDWSASFLDPVGGPPTIPPEYFTVQWTYFGTMSITAGGPLYNTATGPFFQIDSPDMLPGLFQYTFHDHLGTDTNIGGGTFSVAPEPSSLVLIGLGGPAGLYLLRRSRRRAAA